MSSVLLEYEGRLARITLNRPEAGNAIDLTLARELHQAVAGGLGERADVVLLRGAGRHFCVGGDVREFAAAEDTQVFVSLSDAGSGVKMGSVAACDVAWSWCR